MEDQVLKPLQYHDQENWVKAKLEAQEKLDKGVAWWREWESRLEKETTNA